MKSINALSLTPGVEGWLANSRHPHILHIFDQACNLINERGEILSIVTPKIGNGPFNFVVRENVSFSGLLRLLSPILISASQLNIGALTIQMGDAKLWSPKPRWETLHQKREEILHQVREIVSTLCFGHVGKNEELPNRNPALPEIRISQLSIYPSMQSLISNLPSALAIIDIPAIKEITCKLAGLGPGLTPAGDDFLVGMMYAVWLIHPPEVAAVIAGGIADIAAPLTTSLSAAWLRSAARGEAGCLWHEFFESLLAEDRARIRASLRKIQSIGATSGTDALAGFVGTTMELQDHAK